MTTPSSPWWIAALCLLAVGIVTRQEGNGFAGAEHEPPVISAEVGSWRCREITPQRTDYVDESVDTAWSGVCEDSGGSKTEVYVGYAGWQGQQKKLASPRLHYPGGDRGWSYVTTRRVDVPVDGDCHGQLRASETVLQHSVGIRHAMLYWYQRGWRTFAEEVGFRLELIRAKLVRRPTDSVVIRIAAPVSEDSAEPVFGVQMDLARGIYCEVAR